MPFAIEGYEHATGCADARCQPGTRALYEAVLALDPRFQLLGCFNCRHVRGSRSTWSLHAEGRATDIGFHDPGDQTRHGGEAGRHLQVICDRIIRAPRQIGCQQIIYDARIWRYGDPGWRPFDGGSGPHHDHAHIELSWDAARRLTHDDVRRFLTGGSPMPDDPDPDYGGQTPVAVIPAGRGYHLVTRDGAVYSFRCTHHGSAYGQSDHPIVTATGVQGGYFLVAADGGVFAYGTARYAGSLPQLRNRGTIPDPSRED